MRNPPKDMQHGCIHKTNSHGKVKVISHKPPGMVLVEFIDSGWSRLCDVVDLRNGKTKDLMRPTVQGVGFIGDGIYSTRDGRHKTKQYMTWNGMITRCYSDSWHKKKPSYSECETCEEWQNFQNFAAWYDDNYPNDGLHYELDKDLLVMGNKIYSPETCLFIPRKINSFLNSGSSNMTIFLPGARPRNSLFNSTCGNPITGKREYLGQFETEIEAHLAWAARKKEIAAMLANSDIQMCDRTRKALLNVDFRQVSSSED